MTESFGMPFIGSHPKQSEKGLVHGLDHDLEGCENKPKEKEARKKRSEGPTMQLFD